MERYQHSIPELFKQLGLGHSAEEIADFINQHNGLVVGTSIHEAIFWSSSQAAFLKEAIDEDADWAEIVDQLDTMLRS
ncbi:DUF2789 domain-containing protein [Vibrio sp. SCSIO 43135]|uniref:DUF2789 domain-containing protein n=1 Tax=Vibrio sp. SCSIO 43135 TaxID=2819096 RepID=UPI002075F824|nr:DUF2789 domain-containing protein [Vibrio sp. SCSIO 43135]USD42524.1 DUF2789 domain-containing protein [Vibrio sp. SCSIO 43135]